MEKHEVKGGFLFKILNLVEGPNDLPEKVTDEGSKNVVKELRLAMLKLVSKHLDETKGTINYLTLPHAEEFKDFKIISQELLHCNPLLLKDEEKKAFFINVYNVLTLHALAEYHCKLDAKTSIKSTLDIPHFWERFGYKIGVNSFSLDDIEHGILRANSAHPTTKKKMFGEKDPRLQLALNSIDPRIHFALNCGAKSCPMVSVYSSENLDQKLEIVTRAYLQQEVTVEKGPDGKVLILPQILEWYGADFAKDERGVLRWIMKYTENGTRKMIESLVTNEEEPLDNIKYIYDWSLNQKPRQ